MRSVWFHPDADAEMTEAAQYYEQRAFGLGLSFLDAVEAAVDKLLQEPEAYGLVGDEIRQKLVDRFPYSLLYEPMQGQQTLGGCRALCKKWYDGKGLTKVVWDDKWYDP